MTGYVAPDAQPRNGVTHYTAAGLQAALDACAYLDGTQRLRMFTDTASASLTLTTTLTDITGCSRTFSVNGANAFAVVIGSFDVDVSSGATASALGSLDVGGVTQTGNATKGLQAVDRQTVTQCWNVALAAGSRTLKLRAQKDLNVAAAAVLLTNTRMEIFLVDHR